jgi:predicted O-methyltransferase YrrM
MFAGVEEAREFAAGAEKATMRYRAFLETLERLQIPGRYLDVGAGPGIVAAMVARRRPEVKITALELSEAMVAVGQEVVARQGLQDRIAYVQGDAADRTLLQSLGKFNLIYSTFSLHEWAEPRSIIDTLLLGLAESGVLFIHDLRRVWWLYPVPVKGGFFQSVRASYQGWEIEAMLQGYPTGCYEVREEFPFLLSMIIKPA